MAETIAAIKKELEEAGFEGREAVMKKYKTDSRQGVQNLLQKYEKKKRVRPWVGENIVILRH